VFRKDVTENTIRCGSSGLVDDIGLSTCLRLFDRHHRCGCNYRRRSSRWGRTRFLSAEGYKTTPVGCTVDRLHSSSRNAVRECPKNQRHVKSENRKSVFLYTDYARDQSARVYTSRLPLPSALSPSSLTSLLHSFTFIISVEWIIISRIDNSVAFARVSRIFYNFLRKSRVRFFARRRSIRKVIFFSPFNMVLFTSKLAFVLSSRNTELFSS